MSGWPTTSRHSRGYGSAWDRIRLIVLRRDNGLCMCGECQGGTLRLTPANEVHHIVSKTRGGTDALDNLIAINSECHARITAAEQGRTLRPRATVGADGWSV